MLKRGTYMLRARIVSFASWLVVSLWSRMIKVRLANQEIRDRLQAEGQNFIYAFWHGDLFLLLHSSRNSEVLIPVSESSDGEIMARMLNRFGLEVVRGSSFRNGHKALFGMISHIRKGGTIGIAVDGPRGPVHKVKRGVVFLASKSGLPIIPVACASKRFWILEKTWEKLVLPAPFTKAVIAFGEPVCVQGTSEEEIESGRRRLEQALCSLAEEARNHLASGIVENQLCEYKRGADSERVPVLGVRGRTEVDP